MAVLILENTSDAEVERVRLELPDDAILLFHEAALKLVSQRTFGYVLFPLIPGILGLSSGGDRYGQAIFGAMGVIGLGSGFAGPRPGMSRLDLPPQPRSLCDGPDPGDRPECH